MDIKNAIAVVSGGASGLGNAVARRVVEEGGRVAILDVSEEQGQAAAAALGDSAIFVQTDVSDEDAVNAAVAKARDPCRRRIRDPQPPEPRSHRQLLPR